MRDKVGFAADERARILDRLSEYPFLKACCDAPGVDGQVGTDDDTRRNQDIQA